MNETETTSSAALILPTSSNALDRINDPIDAVEKMGTWFAKSGMFGCEKVEQGQILALAALLERKSPIEIADTYHLINGQLAMRSRAQLAKFRAAGGRVKWLKSDAEICEADWTFEGETTRVGFTLAEAQQMGITRKGSGWDKAPAEMLRARCTTRAITMLAPEILVGGAIEDEVAHVAPPTQPAPNPLKQMVVTHTVKSEPKPTETTAITSTPEPEIVVESEPEPEPVEQLAKAEEAIEEGVGIDYATQDQIGKIMEIVADCELAAVDYLVDKKWIPSADEPTKIEASNAAKIIKNPKGFLRAVAKFADGK